MPIYPYKCYDCGTEFEVIRKSSDDGNEFCKECGARLTIENRVIAKTSFKLTGGGWFSDGYSKDNNNFRIKE